MDAHLWKRLEALFFDALDLDPAARAAFLDEACRDDAELRRELEAMLAAEEDGHMLALESRLLAEEPPPGPSPIGSSVGPYRIERLLGEGGMGEVYLASRADDQYEARVALKVVRAGFRSSELASRFRVERQVLARLSHPNITQLLDGGIDDHGQPYLVMQYVEGIPITTYCDRNALSIEARLVLFRTVCAAVQHAHRNMVVHRDLKPSNILVTEEGVVKLLDFGIAKLLDPTPGISIAETRSQLRLMTPEYAAPEQVRGQTITTSTDVYALGVLLYELLTGRRPYRFGPRVQAEMERIICEEDPLRPSTAVTEGREDAREVEPTPDAVGRARRTGVSRLKKMLQGDLDNIVMMALRKEPERRYVSAEQLSEDVRRHLAGRPVSAQKDTLGYRVAKFVRRNRIPAAAAAVLILMLVAFSVSTALQSRRVAEERDRAELEARRATQVSEFLIDLFDGADPSASQGETVLAKDILRAGAERIERDLAGQPELQASLMVDLGRVHRRLGLLDESLALYRRSAQIRDSLFGDDNVDVAHSNMRVAETLVDKGQFKEARALLDVARPVLERDRDLMHGDIAILNNTLGFLSYQAGELDTARVAFEKAIAIWRARSGEYDEGVMMGLSSLGAVLIAQNEPDSAEKRLREALAIADSLRLEKHVVATSALNNLAHVMVRQKQYDEAERGFRRVIEIRRELFGDVHPSIPVAYNNLSMTLRAKGDLAAAEDVAAEGLAIQRQIGGAVVGRALTNLGAIQLDRREYAAAEATTREALPILIDGYGEGHALVKSAREQLVKIYEGWGKPAEAERYRALLAQAGANG